MQAKSFTLVSGSSRGLGWNIAEYLRSQGIEVFTNSRNSPLGNVNSANHIVFDSANRIEVQASLSEIRSASYSCTNLVINAGSGGIRLDNEDEQWSSNIEVNLISATTLFEVAISIFPMIQNVVFISTVAASKVMIEPPLQYSVSKSALNTFAKHMAAKYARSGIRINVIAPGNLDFEGSVWDRKRQTSPMEVESYLNEQVPSRRLVPVAQISKLVYFLLTENTDIIGQVIGVDGGQSI